VIGPGRPDNATSTSIRSHGRGAVADVRKLTVRRRPASTRSHTASRRVNPSDANTLPCSRLAIRPALQYPDTRRLSAPRTEPINAVQATTLTDKHRLVHGRPGHTGMLTGPTVGAATPSRIETQASASNTLCVVMDSRDVLLMRLSGLVSQRIEEDVCE
jgi:hypothetical protein